MSTLLEQASLVLIPSGYKEDTVYSVIPSNGSGDMSFTRASDGTRINSDGLVEVCPWNIFQYSEQFDNGVWSKTGVTISANNTVAPNGTTTADKIVSINGATQCYVSCSSTTTDGINYTLSAYVKKAGANWVQLIIVRSYVCRVWVNLTNGAIGTNNGNFSSVSVDSMGNDWYRIKAVFPSITSAFALISIANADNIDGFTGDGTSGLYVWGAQLNIGSTAKPYFPTTDRLNVPRLTYQNGGGGCPSLLLEPQRTNLLTYSEDFTIWTKGQFLASLPTVTADYGISPSGVQNADRVQMTRPSGASYVEITKQSFITIGTVITFSVFIKSLIGATKMTIGGTGSSNTINLTNDWVRYTYTMTTTNNPTTFTIAINGSAADSLTADFLVWGAQVEAGAYQSSYIPTVASSATRIVDACYRNSYAGGITSEGTIFADFEYLRTDGGYSTPCLIINGINYIYMFVISNSIRALCVNGGVVQSQIISGTITPNTRYKVAARFKTNDFSLYVNGALIGTTSSGTMPTLSTSFNTYVGTDSSFTEPVGKLNELVIFPTALTNAQLATLTTI